MKSLLAGSSTAAPSRRRSCANSSRFDPREGSNAEDRGSIDRSRRLEKRIGFFCSRLGDAIMVAMASIDVKQSDAGDTLSFEVTVTETSGATSHSVTLDASQFARLRRGDEDPERFIERCFEFLLAREPKESIMSSFDVSVISRYFPEFERNISE